MVALPRKSTVSDFWQDFEEGIYTLEFRRMEPFTGGKKEFGPSVIVFFLVEDLARPDTGEAAETNVLMSLKMSQNPKTGQQSDLLRLCCALLGREVADDEDVTDDMLAHRRCQARLYLNEGGFLTIDKKTFAKIRGASQRAIPVAATVVEAVPAAARPVSSAPAKVAPPPPSARVAPPAAPADPNAHLRQSLATEIETKGYQSWFTESFGLGKTVATLSDEELTGALEALGLPTF